MNIKVYVALVCLFFMPSFHELVSIRFQFCFLFLSQVEIIYFSKLKTFFKAKVNEQVFGMPGKLIEICF